MEVKLKWILRYRLYLPINEKKKKKKKKKVKFSTTIKKFPIISILTIQVFPTTTVTNF